MALRIGHVLALVLAGLSAQGCTRGSEPKAAVDTVNIPNTPARDQGQAGICWAYATASLVEAEAVRRTGKEFDISEEAISFYAQLEKLMDYAGRLSGSSVRDVAAFDAILEADNEDLEGWFVRSGGYMRLPDGIGIIEKYGAVPEAVWSRKFEAWYGTGDTLKATVKERFVKLLQGRQPGTITTLDIIEKVLVGPGAYQSAPPTEFDVTLPGGQRSRVTAKSFAKDVLKFNPSDFESRQFRSVKSLDSMVQIMKSALVRGQTVALSFGVDFKLFDDKLNGFVARGRTDHEFKPDGGHAVLVTDFVNKGAVAGAMTPKEIAAEAARPASDLDYVVIKNSWGRKQHPNGISARGLIVMDREYLEANLRAGRSISIVVSRTAANSAAALDRRVALQMPAMKGPFLETCENPAVADAERAKTVEVLKGMVPGANCREKWTRLYNLVEIDLSGKDVANLEPLVGLDRLRSLFVAKNRVSDLAPVASLKSLVELDAKGNALTSIAGLGGLDKLEILSLDGNAVASLEPLSRAVRLLELSVSGNPVGSFAPIAGAKGMRRLLADGVATSDLSPLADMKSMRVLSIRSMRVTSVASLAGLTELERLDISGNEVSDVTPLKGLSRVFRLKLAGNKVSDVAPLGELKNIVNVDVSDNPVVSLEFLRGLPRLQIVGINGIALQDVSPLTAHPSMLVLSVERTGLKDLGFVSSFKGLLELSISGNAVSDLSPLVGLADLESFKAAENPIDRADRTRCPVESVAAPVVEFCSVQ